MSTAATETTATEATTATETTAEATAATTATEATTTATETSTDPWADPAKAKAEIDRLRAENGRDRTAGKEEAAQAARDELLEKLGLKQADKPADGPEALAAQLTEKDQALTAATTAQRTAEVKLAIITTALEQGADHAALLDSNSFLATLDGLDPSDSEKITEAIKAAVEKNPKLKATQAVATSRVDTSGGSGEGAITKAAFDAMNNADRNKLYQTNLPLYRQLAGK